MTPMRAALDADTRARASTVNRERAGEGISTQAFNLRPKLQEVERLAFAHAYRFVEVHPEVSFRGSRGGRWRRRSRPQRGSGCAAISSPP
jgi:predicted RNase H-like nuclease